MQYLIGQILKRHIQDNKLIIRHLAIDADMDRSALSNILAGNRTATDKLLSRVIDTEILKEPLRDYIKQNIDTLDTTTIIDIYNAIYNNYKNQENQQRIDNE